MSEIIIRKCIGIFVSAVLLSIGFCQIGLAAGSSVSVSPQMTTASLGDVFTIDIVVDPMGSEIFGVQYELQFDNNLLKATDQNKGRYLSHDDADTIEVSNNINNTIGKIEYGETRIGDPDVIGGVTNPGVLASVNFEVIGSGTCDLKLEVLLSDSKAQPIDTVVNNGTCSVKVVETPGYTAPTKQTTAENGLPGFGIVCSIIGLIVAFSLMIKKGFK